MEEKDMEQIKKWFRTVFDETHKIRVQNAQTLEWMEPTFVNVRNIYDMVYELGEDNKRLKHKLSLVDDKLQDLQDKLEALDRKLR